MTFTYMGKTIASLDDLNLNSSKVLVRVDFNSPISQDGGLLDDTRLRMHVPTIKRLLGEGASVVLMSHQGRPLEGDFTRLRAHAERLSQLLGVEVDYVPDVVGPEAVRRIKALQPGQVLMLDNTRLMSEDYIQAPPERHAESIIVRELAPHFNYYINDAFAVSHRSQATVVGFPLLLPSAGGLLMEKEVRSLSRAVEGGERPRTLVLGGAKLKDAVKLIKSLVANRGVDEVLTTGLVSLLFHMVMGTRLPRSIEALIEERVGSEDIVEARRLVASGAPIRVPLDYMVEVDGGVEIHPAREVRGAPKDIGPSTIEYYRYKLLKSKVTILRGPAGVIEDPRFRRGTREILRAALESDAFVILGGGHFNAILGELPQSLVERVDHISSGGGAMIYFLTRKPLPGLEALALSYEKFWGARG